MATREDFCSYEDLESRCTPLSALSGVASGDLVEAIANASELIWALTGRQFGAYTETVRPDLRGVSSSVFDLRRFPVTGVTEVKIDGATVPSSAYWVSDGHFLNRTDGTSWPTTQKLYLDDTEEDTFSVTLTWGTAPPVAVVNATRRLACELLSLKFGGQSALPERVRSTVRQGISMEHVSAEDLLNNGRTGIYEIDLALQTYNSDEAAALPAVMSPDIGWYDHDGTTTVGASPNGGGVSMEQVLLAISAATSGISGGLTEEQVMDLVLGETTAPYSMLLSPATISAFGGTLTDGVSLVMPAFNGLFPAGRKVVVWDGDFNNAAGRNGSYVSDGVQTFTFDSVAPFNTDGLGKVHSASNILQPWNLGNFEAWTVQQQAGVGFGLALVDTQPTINLDALYTYNLDLTANNFVPMGTPAGLLIGLDGQTNIAENGYYLSNGSGGVVVGSRMDLVASGTYQYRINCGVIFTTEQSAYGALSGFIDTPDANSYARGGSYRVATADGVNYYLDEVLPPLTDYINMVGRWFSPAMNDYSLNADTQLTLNHQIVSVDTSGGNVQLTLGPHATIPRPLFIWHRVGGNTLTVVNYPGDGDAFSITIPAGERRLILPDGAAWIEWQLPQKASDLPYTPTTSGDWTEGAPKETGDALDKLAARAWAAADHNHDGAYDPAGSADAVPRLLTLSGVVDGDVTISTLESTLSGYPPNSLFLIGAQSVVTFKTPGAPAWIGMGGTVTGGSGPGIYLWDGTNLTILTDQLATSAERRDPVQWGGGVIDQSATVLYQAPLTVDCVILEIDFGGGAALTLAGSIPDLTASIPVVLLYKSNQDVGTNFLPPGVPPGSYIILDAQTNPAERGMWEATALGGVENRVDIYTGAYYGRTFTAIFVQGNASANPIYPYLPSPNEDQQHVKYVMGTQDGVTFSLWPQTIDYDTVVNLTGRAFSPAMQDFAVNSSTQLTLGHQIVSVDTSGGDVTLTMGPHATIPRHTYVWHRTGSGVCTIVNLPGDGDAFSYVVPPGEHVLVLPDGAAWHAWKLPQNPFQIPYTPTTPADWTEGAPDNAGSALDKLAARPLATKGFVNHGSTAGTARPSGYASVEWYGTVEPTNAIEGDTWNDPT